MSLLKGIFDAINDSINSMKSDAEFFDAETEALYGGPIGLSKPTVKIAMPGENTKTTDIGRRIGERLMASTEAQYVEYKERCVKCVLEGKPDDLNAILFVSKLLASKAELFIGKKGIKWLQLASIATKALENNNTLELGDIPFAWDGAKEAISTLSADKLSQFGVTEGQFSTFKNFITDVANVKSN